MSWSEFLLFGHLLAVITWVGTDVSTQFLARRALAAGPAEQVRFMRDVEWLGTRLLVPVSLLAVIFGVLLVSEVGYGFGDTWVVLGLAGFGFSFLLGAAFLGPETGRIGRLIDERGEEDPEVQRRIGRIILLSRVELLVLLAVVLDMVVKPA